MHSSQSQHSLAGANYACRHRHPRGQDVCPYQLGSVPHELTTNAAEYGALSIGQGLVHVTWQIEADNLLLRWEGPRIEKTPTSEGLGSTLVPRARSAPPSFRMASHIAYDRKISYDRKSS